MFSISSFDPLLKFVKENQVKVSMWNNDHCLPLRLEVCGFYHGFFSLVASGLWARGLSSLRSSLYLCKWINSLLGGYGVWKRGYMQYWHIIGAQERPHSFTFCIFQSLDLKLLWLLCAFVTWMHNYNFQTGHLKDEGNTEAFFHLLISWVAAWMLMHLCM